jgi:AcrR family transcriptional regulator
MQQMMVNRQMSIQKSTDVVYASIDGEGYPGGMEQALTTDATAETTDPRILRSRRMLMDSLATLLTRKEFNDISIQEIADEATLNRATFYLHYPDKNALLQAMTAARFRELIARRGLAFSDCDGALRAIALGVCDYLAETTGCPTQLVKMSLEGSIIPVVESMFREGAANHPVSPGTDPALQATTAAWAIFGAARRWYQTPNRIPAEEMASKIAAIVKPVLLTASASAPKRNLDK